MLALGAQQNRPDVGVGIDHRPDRGKVAMHRIGQCVTLLRTIEGDDQNAGSSKAIRREEKGS